MTSEVQIHCGSEVIGNGNIYLFPFLFDRRFLNSESRTVLEKLAGPDNTIHYVEEVAEELKIVQPLTVVRKIPDPDDLWRIVDSTGLACRGTAKYTIELYFDPLNANTMRSLSTWSGRQIAHELNHVARTEEQPLHTTFLDALIGEGLGVYHEEHFQNWFESSVWGNALTQEQIDYEWNLARQEIDSTHFKFGDWFWGELNGHSRFTGYSLGNAIVTDFFNNNSNIALAEAVRMPSRDILSKTRYKL